MKRLVMEAYPNCKYPVIAMYFKLSWHNRERLLCEHMNVTPDLLHAFLWGKEDLTSAELHKFALHTFKYQDHMSSHHRTFRKREYLLCPVLPFYTMNKRKHRNKVETIKAEYEKAFAEAKEYSLSHLPVGSPNFQPLPFFGGIILRKEIDTALYAIKAYRREISLKTKVNVPRDIKQKTA